jgi:hypothetical protein
MILAQPLSPTVLNPFNQLNCQGAKHDERWHGQHDEASPNDAS